MCGEKGCTKRSEPRTGKRIIFEMRRNLLFFGQSESANPDLKINQSDRYSTVPSSVDTAWTNPTLVKHRHRHPSTLLHGPVSTHLVHPHQSSSVRQRQYGLRFPNLGPLWPPEEDWRAPSHTPRHCCLTRPRRHLGKRLLCSAFKMRPPRAGSPAAASPGGSTHCSTCVPAG